MPPVTKSKPLTKEELEKKQIEDAKVSYKKALKRNHKWFYWIAPAIGTVSWWLRSGSQPSVQATSVALRECLNTVCSGGTDGCVGYPEDSGFYTQWSHPYNKALNVIPAAVIRPKNPEDVSAIVKCAAQNNVKVQARSGGHSYANHGLGGYNGSISIDLGELKYVIVNSTSGQAKIGSGSQLIGIDDELKDRTFPHGICPGVGIGGHATVGGLGPMSRMWGTALDHVDEIQVVIANGSIVRASQNENEDLFFALRGAGAGFGIVTEFVMRTHKKLNNVVYFTINYKSKNIEEMVKKFQAWQGLIALPRLDRRFGTEFWLNSDGAEIRSAFYGSKAEFLTSSIFKLISDGKYQLDEKNRIEKGLHEGAWEKAYQWQTDNFAMWHSDTPSEFYSRSLGFTNKSLLSDSAIKDIFQTIHQDGKDSGAFKWFVIFDATGGQISDIPMDATAYAHRDKVMFYQSYSLNPFKMGSKVPQFLNNIHEKIVSGLPQDFQYSTYPGYIDPYLENAQPVYWGSNLPRLQQIKAQWDPNNIFCNPQSVRKA